MWQACIFAVIGPNTIHIPEIFQVLSVWQQQGKVVGEQNEMSLPALIVEK